MTEVNNYSTDFVVFYKQSNVGLNHQIHRLVGISDGMISQLYFSEITYAKTSGFKLGKLAFSRMMKCISGSPFVQTIIDQSDLVSSGSL